MAKEKKYDSEQIKKCSECSESIQSSATKCKHCGADLRNWFIRHKVLSGILGFILLSIIIGSLDDNQTTNTAGSIKSDAPLAELTDSNQETAKSPSKAEGKDPTVKRSFPVDVQPTKTPVVVKKPTEVLELLSYRCYSEYGYFHITGEIKNISNKPLENVVAVGTAYTKEDGFVKSDEALIEYNPILVGQTSPFQVMITGNPQISKCKVDFKEFWGSSISTKRSN